MEAMLLQLIYILWHFKCTPDGSLTYQGSLRSLRKSVLNGNPASATHYMLWPFKFTPAGTLTHQGSLRKSALNGCVYISFNSSGPSNTHRLAS